MVPSAIETSLQNTRGLGRQGETDKVLGKKPGIHELEIVGYDQRKFCLIQDLRLQVDTRRYFRKRDAIPGELHDATLGDIGNVLALLDRTATRESDVLDLVHQFLQLALLL